MPFFTNRGIIPLPTVSAGDFVGDIAADADVIAYYGCCAYTEATKGGVVMQVKRYATTAAGPADELIELSTDATTGILDLTNPEISDLTDTTGQAYFVTIWYDLTGNGHDVTDTMSNLRLRNESGVPCILNPGGGTGFVFDDTISEAQPFTIASCVNPPSFESSLYLDGSGAQVGFNHTSSAANTAYIYAGGAGVDDTAITTGAWHSIQFLLSGASSSIDIDGSSHPATGVGSTGLVGAGNVMNTTGNLKFRDVGIWRGSQPSLSVAHHALWGF